jgi:hypothetical protein
VSVTPLIAVKRVTADVDAAAGPRQRHLWRTGREDLRVRGGVTRRERCGFVEEDVAGTGRAPITRPKPRDALTGFVVENAIVVLSSRSTAY